MSLILASIPFFTFLLIGAMTPGPNNLMLAASGMNYGYRRTLPHMAGIIFGFYTLLLLCMLGIGVIFTLYPALQLVMKIGSAAFMLYLAYHIAMAGRVEFADEKARPLTFLQAALFQYINPKAWVVGLAATASLLPESATIPEKTLIILVCVLTTSILSTNTWTLFGKIMARLFSKDKYRRIVNATLALLLVATIPMMLLH